MKHVPNTLSILRIVLSICLLFIAENRWAFLVVYLICGLTDYFDGKIARHFNVESALGAKLEAFADSLLFGTAFICVIFLAGIDLGGARGIGIRLATISVGVVYKLANVAVTRKLFSEWNMMHTLMNKTVYGSLFFVAPIFIFLKEVNLWVIVAITGAMCLACLEETITLCKIDVYDVNHKGVITEKILSKIKRAS